MTRKLPLIVVSVCVLLISGGLLLEWDMARNTGLAVNEDVPPVDTHPQALQTSPSAGIKAYDPGSHSQSLEPAKIAVLRERMRHDGDGLEVERRPDGSESLDLQGRFTHFSAAVRSDSGDMEIQCFSGYAPLVDAISGPRPIIDSNQGSREAADY